MYEILHCTPEMVPFSKTGGLADVSFGLPEALSRLGHHVTVVTPLYGTVDRQAHDVRPTGRRIDVTLGGRSSTFEVFETSLPGGTRVLLLACDAFFDRPFLYGTRDGDYPDNALRFAHFSAAVFRVLRAVRLRPDVIHCHDWQTGLVPAFNRVFHLDMFATVVTLHNLAYQGQFPADVMPEVGLPWDLFNPEQVEFFGNVNFLKAGIVFADKVTTVSPRYADEIRTPEFGCGLDGVLRKRGADVVGILNGADSAEWSPRTDLFLPPEARFSARSMAGKRVARDLLLAEFGLPPGDGPLFGAVGRLAHQKGFDLVAQVLPEMVASGARVVLLGTGDRDVEEAVAAAVAAFPGRVGARIAYDNRVAHLVEAGSDFFLMPSRFEPCGLSQIYAMAYGTLPVVHAVGGLENTVVDLDEDAAHGTGLKFREFTREAFLARVARAVRLFGDPTAHARVVRRAMTADFSWDASASAYADLYRQVVR